MTDRIDDTAGLLTPVADTRTPGRLQLLLLLAGSCMAVLGAVTLGPVLPQMAQDFADVPGVGLLVPIVLTVPALVIGVTAPFAGAVADRFDRKRLLIVGLVGYAITGTAPLYLTSLGAIVGSRVLVGLCEAAILTCCTTLIGDYWSGPRRARYLGLQTLVASSSAVVFLAAGGLLGTSGWRAAFWLYLLPALLVVPMAMSIWQPERHGPTTAGKRRLAPVPWDLLLAPCLFTLAGGMLFVALQVELSFVLADLGVTSTATIGGIAALMALATALGSVVFGRMAALRPRTLLPIDFGMTALGLVVVGLGTSVPVVTAGAVIAGLGTGMLLPTLLTWALSRLSFEQRGRGTGLWNGSFFLGEFVAPIGLAAVAVGVGGMQGALTVLGAVAAVLALVAVLAVRRNNNPLSMTED